MAVYVFPSTLVGGVTPVCGDCGVALCYDISDEEYRENQDFWDKWECADCRPDAVGSYLRYRQEKRDRGVVNNT